MDTKKSQIDPYSPGGCFVATVCYGSPYSEEVHALRDFRDSFLASFSLGQKFIEAYYRYSPPLADFIEERGWLRKITRVLVVEPFYLISKLISSIGTNKNSSKPT